MAAPFLPIYLGLGATYVKYIIASVGVWKDYKTQSRILPPSFEIPGGGIATKSVYMPSASGILILLFGLAWLGLGTWGVFHG
jgi:hypothetical protein